MTRCMLLFGVATVMQILNGGEWLEQAMGPGFRNLILYESISWDLFGEPRVEDLKIGNAKTNDRN